MTHRIQPWIEFKEGEEPDNPLYDDEEMFQKEYPFESTDFLTGLARKCPSCGIVAHYDVKGKKPTEVQCPDCEFKFTVQKYNRGERPRS